MPPAADTVGGEDSITSEGNEPMSIVTNEPTITVKCSEPACEHFTTGHDEYESMAEEPVTHTRARIDGVDVYREDNDAEWRIYVDVQPDIDAAGARKLERVLSAAAADADKLNSAARVARFGTFAAYARSLCDAANITEADLARGSDVDAESAGRIFGGLEAEVTISDLAWFGCAVGADPFDLMRAALGFVGAAVQS